MIKLKRLVLHNFMCVEDAELSFDDGVTLIVGSNGQGKSTVLQAVALCLLEEKRSDSFKEFITLGKDDSHVLLEADIKGNPIKIDISLNKKQSGMTRTADYEGRIYTNSEVSDLLESFDIKYYADIIMSMQNEGDITTLKPAEREVYLQKLFQFDFTEKVDKLKETLSSIKKSIDFQLYQVDFNTKSIDDRKNEIRNINELSFTQSDIDNLNLKISSVNAEMSELSLKLKEKDTLTQKKSELQNNVYACQQSIDNANHEIDLIKSNQSMIDTLNDKLKEYDAANESLLKEQSGVNDAIAGLISNMGNIKTECDTLKDKVNKKQIEYSDKNKEVNALVADVLSKDNEIKHAQKHLDMIKLGTCPECGHAFDGVDKDKYQTAFNVATENKMNAQSMQKSAEESLRAIMDELSKLNRDLSVKNTEYSKVSSDLDTENYKLKNIQTQINNNNNSKLRIEGQIRQFTSKMDGIQKLNESITVNQSALQSLKEESAKVDADLAKLSSVSDAYISKQSELSLLQKNMADYNSELAQNNAIIQNNENIKKSISDMEQKIENAKKQVEIYRRQQAEYEEAVTLLDKTFPAWLILKTCQMIESEMNNFIQVIFPEITVKLFQNKRGVEFFYTNTTSKGVSKTKDGLINAKMASGFEKAILSIAFKVALCRAYNLRFAFMDEIDQAGTEENSSLLFKAILSNDLFDQLFVISHKPTVRDVIHSFAPTLKTYYVDKGVFSTEEL